jgi:hypothetical protein
VLVPSRDYQGQGGTTVSSRPEQTPPDYPTLTKIRPNARHHRPSQSSPPRSSNGDTDPLDF